VGGGIAGVITGLELLNGKHAGEYDVTIFEREAAAHTTLCGEGLSHETLSRFTAFDSMPYVAETFPGAVWFFPGDVRVRIDQKCYTMARERWIPAMAEAFQKLGGTYKTGVKVTPPDVERLAKEYDLVVGADGPGSQVRKHVGGEHETLLGIQYRVARNGWSGDRLEFYTDKRWSPEYAWVFPRGDILNVGLLVEGDGKDWERLDAFMKDRGVTGKILKREAYPIGFFGTRLARDNVVLIGDAAGLTNPVTKGGMAAIIYAAEILAEKVKADRVHEYEAAIRGHPITDASFGEAVRIIRRWSNRDFERLARLAPSEMVVGEGRLSAKKRYALPLLATMAMNPGKVRDLQVLAKAMGVSRKYSW